MDLQSREELLRGQLTSNRGLRRRHLRVPVFVFVACSRRGGKSVASSSGTWCVASSSWGWEPDSSCGCGFNSPTGREESPEACGDVIEEVRVVAVKIVGAARGNLGDAGMGSE